MKRKTLKLSVIALILGVIVLTGCRHYSERWHTPEHKTERKVEYFVKELDLNDKQKEQLEESVNNIMLKKDEIMSREMFVSEVLSQLSSEKVDKKHLNNIISVEMKNIEELMKSLVKHIADLHSTLTPDQRTKLVKIIEKRKDRGYRHHSHF